MSEVIMFVDGLPGTMLPMRVVVRSGKHLDQLWFQFTARQRFVRESCGEVTLAGEAL